MGHAHAPILDEFRGVMSNGTLPSDVLFYYKSRPQGGMRHLTSTIGRAFGADSSETLLTLTDDASLVPRDKCLARFRWCHHYYTNWEIMTGRRLLPHVNNIDGLHMAGDSVRGVGHNDAMRAGVSAACNAGFAVQPSLASAPPTYAQLIEMEDNMTLTDF